jgi:hypothetical protein
MKKLFLSFAILFAVTTTFTSCSEDAPPILSPINGFWRCVEIRGSAGNLVNTPTMESDFLRFFHISYQGALGQGVFARIGADASDMAEFAGFFGEGEFDANVWTNLLSAGTFTTQTLTPTTGYVIHRLINGDIIEYRYRLENNGQRLVIIETIASAGANVNNALNLVNIIFGTNVNADVTIEYVYERVGSLAELWPNRD